MTSWRLSGFKSVFVVELFVVQSLLLHVDAGSEAALTMSQLGSLVPLLEQDACICS